MPALKWDRLLDACCAHKAAELLLIAGSPPLLRVDDELHPLPSPPLEVADLADLATQIMPEQSAYRDGYLSFDFDFGIIARFRLAAFGCPQPKLLLVMRLSKLAKSGAESSP